MIFVNIIINFISIISIYLTSVYAINCEYDNIAEEQSNTSVIDINCNGYDCNTIDSNIFFDDNFLIINTAGTYRINGNLNGQILVKASEEDFVNLILNGIQIVSISGPSILIVGAEKVTLTLNDKNFLYDNYNNTNGATIHSLSNLTITGNGKLSILNRNKIAILCDKELKLIEGQIIIGILEQQLMEDKSLRVIIDKDGILKAIQAEDENLTEILANDNNLRIIPIEQLLKEENLKLILTGDGNLRIIQNKVERLQETSLKQLMNNESLRETSLEQLLKNENSREILAKNVNLIAILAKNLICINDTFNIINELVDENDMPRPPSRIGTPMTGGSPTDTYTRATTCSSAIKLQGYPCCPSNCKVVYVDECGTWGVVNNRWCGCKGGGNNDYSCQSSIIKQGYKCCSRNNCNIILKDETGRWGVENKQWCGIHFTCK